MFIYVMSWLISHHHRTHKKGMQLNSKRHEDTYSKQIELLTSFCMYGPYNYGTE